MSLSHDIVDHLKIIGQNAEFLAQVLRQKTVLMTEENQNKIQRLFAKKILIDLSQEKTYRLAPWLERHLNELISRNNVFTSAHDCRNHLESLTTLRDRYITENVDDGNEEYLDEISRDFENVVSQMSSTIQKQLAVFEEMARNHFGHAKTEAARKRQNKEAIKQAEMLGDAIQGISNPKVLEDYKNPRAYILREIYERELLDQQRKWQSSWHTVIGLLRKYLNQRREYNLRAQQFRAAAEALRSNTLDAEMSLYRALHENAPAERRWLCPVTPNKIHYPPSLEDHWSGQEVAQAAKKLPKDDVIREVVKKKSDAARSNILVETPEEELTEQVAPNINHQALLELIRDLTPMPVGVVDWLEENYTPEAGPHPDSLMGFIMNLHTGNEHWPPNVRMEPIYMHVPHLCGNKIIMDMRLWKA